jgi:hypothetical protein
MSGPCFPADPAFPILREENDVFLGLTKREYFAAHILQGLCADPELGEVSALELSRKAVEFADYLITRLNKE